MTFIPTSISCGAIMLRLRIPMADRAGSLTINHFRDFFRQPTREYYILNTEDELIVAPSSTCTRDEAVARLLGWMKGPQYPKNIHFGQFGVPTNQYIYLQHLEGNIQNQLTLYRETARQEWVSANASDNEDSSASAKVLLDCYDLAAKAERYLIEIDDEIAKENKSALRIDQAATQKAKETHYTLKSVDEWAKRIFGLSVIQSNFYQDSSKAELSFPPISTELLASEEIANIAGNDVWPDRENSHSRNSLISVDQFPYQGNVPDERDESKASKKGLGEIKANNLYITLALLVEDYASICSGYTTAAGDSIEDVIAKQIAIVGKKANKDQYIRGIGSEAIRKNIAEAMKRKAAKLNWG